MSIINNIRTSLFTLDKYIMKVDYVIKKFNQYVKSKHKALMLGDEQVAGLITNLVIAYNCTTDPMFKHT